MKKFYCQISRSQDFEGTVDCMMRAKDYVDYCVVVEHDYTKEQEEALKKFADNLILVRTVVVDNFPEKRNRYMKVVEERADDDTWVIVSDADEFFCKQFFEDLDQIIENLKANGYDMACINCREVFECVEWLDELDLLKECPGGYRESDYYKCLLFKFYKGLRYVGIGTSKNVHETFNKQDWKAIYLDKDKYWYEHRKSALKIWQRAGENFFIGGGGDCVASMNPYWIPFREACKKYGITTSDELIRRIRNKEVPEEIEKFFREFISNKPIFATDYGREMRELAKFFYYHHPEKISEEIKKCLQTPPERDEKTKIEDYVRQTYFRVLGRHPDRDGLEYWTKMILEGKILKRQLPEIFRRSPEYRQKFGEDVKVNVPVDVKVHLSQDAILQALRRSEIWWKDIKPRLDLARFLESMIDNKEEFYDEFYAKKELEGLSLENFFSLLTKYSKDRK